MSAYNVLPAEVRRAVAEAALDWRTIIIRREFEEDVREKVGRARREGRW